MKETFHNPLFKATIQGGATWRLSVQDVELLPPNELDPSPSKNELQAGARTAAGLQACFKCICLKLPNVFVSNCKKFCLKLPSTKPETCHCVVRLSHSCSPCYDISGGITRSITRLDSRKCQNYPVLLLFLFLCFFFCCAAAVIVDHYTLRPFQ